MKEAPLQRSGLLRQSRLKKTLLTTVLFSQALGSVTPAFASGGRSPTKDEGTPHTAGSSGTRPVSPEVPAISLDDLRAQLATMPDDAQWTHLVDLVCASGKSFEAQQKALEPVFWEMAQDKTHQAQYSAIAELWSEPDLYTAADRQALQTSLLEMVHNPKHRNHMDALSLLWRTGRDQNPIPEHQAQLHQELRPLLTHYIDNPEHHYHWAAIQTLQLTSGSDAEEYKTLVQPHVLAAATNPDHPSQWTAIHWLISKPDLHPQLHPFVIEAAMNPEHSYHEFAVNWVWKYMGDLWAEGRTQCHAGQLNRALKETEKNPDTSQTWFTVWKLWDSPHEDQAQNRLDLAPRLRELAEDRENPSHLRIALTLTALGREEYAHIAPILLEEAQNLLPLLERMEVAQRWYYISLLLNMPYPADQVHYTEVFQPLLWPVTEDTSSPYCLLGTSFLWSCGGDARQNNRVRLTPTLLERGRNAVDPEDRYWALLMLWQYAHEQYQAPENAVSLREEVYPLLLDIARHPEHVCHWEAVSRIWKTYEDQAGQIQQDVEPLLLAIAQNEAHPNFWEAVQLIEEARTTHATYASAAYPANKEAIRPALLRVAQNPNHEARWKAINNLIFDGPTYQDLFLPALIEAVSLPEHASSVIILWTFNGAGWADARARFRPLRVAEALEEMNRTMNCEEWYKVWHVWNSDREDREANRQDLTPRLRELVTDPLNSLTSSTQIALALWRAGGENRAFALPILLARIPQDANIAWGIINILWNERDDVQEDTRQQVRPALVTMAETPGHPHQRDAIRLLRESNDPEDQALGLRLQLEHFPVVYSEELKALMAPFNTNTFVTHARPPLADLSRKPMDLVRKFAAFFDQIESADESSPFYLQAAVITGEEVDAPLQGEANAIRLREIALRAMGFLKTLEGKPLAEGETSGWQMYEEHKPDLINTLKHLVKALKKKHDPATRLNNLGIILKGLLYCPTGQAEGMNSVVNTLIHGKNRGAGTIDDKIHTLVQEAVTQAFLNAFHEGGGVHNLARARGVLQALLGLSQAVSGFEERISHVSEHEVPGILQEFFTLFTPEFLVQYLLNNTQTPEDIQFSEQIREKPKQMAREAAAAASISAASTSSENLGALNDTKEMADLRHRVKLNNQARPLGMGDLMAWFSDHGLAGRLEEFGFDIIKGTGVLNAAGALEILKTLGYIVTPETAAAEASSSSS